jgi:dihydropteroate synthase
MMGIGNLTELTDVDSAAMNLVLLAICQELGVRSVLTTQVINWARTSVRECDLARRLVHYAIMNRVPPKHLDESLVVLRDAEPNFASENFLTELAARIRDNNYRIFHDGQEIHLLGAGQHCRDADPFKLFDQLLATHPTNVDPSHAFYLGYEMCKAMLANQLSKEYRQDEALNWGYLTVAETDRHRLKKRKRENRES